MRQEELLPSPQAAVSMLALLVLAGNSRAAFAQDAWNFSNEIPCATVPVYGVPFTRCWASNVRTFRVGNVQSWRLTYTDSKSEVAIGFYRLVEAHGVGGMSAVAARLHRLATNRRCPQERHGGWIRLGLERQSGGRYYVTFQKAQRQCVAFVRNGPAVNGQSTGSWAPHSAASRLRRYPTMKLQFIADAVQVKG